MEILAIEHYDLNARKAALDELQARLDEQKLQREHAKDSIVTCKEYLKLFQNIGVILAETHDMQQMDFVIKKFFSNFTVKDPGRAEKQR